ncbi:MAG TPA: exodeoxyribonuclease I [Nevskiaceae bacterium]
MPDQAAATPPVTLLWYDYETTGVDRAMDRPLQFAAQRTTLDLEPVGPPTNLYCRLAPDVLPQPEACLLTGLTPRRVAQKGLLEAEFAARVRELVGAPGTCSAGYNSVRFDDEINRFLFYRNFIDPYAHTWRDGTSRWDILDLVRACHALRPEGIRWPLRDDGAPSFRLEHLASENALEQPRAHDACSDVVATIALAKLVRRLQPRLYEWHFAARNKRMVAGRMAAALRGREPLVHVSSRYPAERACLALVLPLTEFPGRAGAQWVVADLNVDPAVWMDLSADDLAERLYTRAVDLPDGVARPPLKVVHANRSPFIAPRQTLRGADAARLGVDVERAMQNRDRICAAPGLVDRIRSVYARSRGEESHREVDPEVALYAGFLSDADRRLCDEVRASTPEALATASFAFSDPRLPELLLRYRARNWPQTVSGEESRRWEAYVRRKLEGRGPEAALTLAGYVAGIARLRRVTPPGEGQAVLDELAAWGEQVAARFGPIDVGAAPAVDAAV